MLFPRSSKVNIGTTAIDCFDSQSSCIFRAQNSLLTSNNFWHDSAVSTIIDACIVLKNTFLASVHNLNTASIRTAEMQA